MSVTLSVLLGGVFYLAGVFGLPLVALQDEDFVTARALRESDPRLGRWLRGFFWSLGTYLTIAGVVLVFLILQHAPKGPWLLWSGCFLAIPVIGLGLLALLGRIGMYKHTGSEWPGGGNYTVANPQLIQRVGLGQVVLGMCSLAAFVAGALANWSTAFPPSFYR